MPDPIILGFRSFKLFKLVLYLLFLHFITSESDFHKHCRSFHLISPLHLPPEVFGKMILHLWCLPNLKSVWININFIICRDYNTTILQRYFNLWLWPPGQCKRRWLRPEDILALSIWRTISHRVWSVLKHRRLGFHSQIWDGFWWQERHICFHRSL